MMSRMQVSRCCCRRATGGEEWTPVPGIVRQDGLTWQMADALGTPQYGTPNPAPTQVLQWNLWSDDFSDHYVDNVQEGTTPGAVYRQNVSPGSQLGQEQVALTFQIAPTKLSTTVRIRCATPRLIDTDPHNSRPYVSSTATAYWIKNTGVQGSLPPDPQLQDLQGGLSVPWPSWAWGKTDVDTDYMVIPATTVSPIYNDMQSDPSYVLGDEYILVFKPDAMMTFNASGAIPIADAPQMNSIESGEVELDEQ